ncbi:MAG: hypothetical protein EOO51_14340 [Flavobacterium sp.]|nr:MAG: hypothetical protein EOO51_14340 [Flavobacterium sp.]
MKTLILTAAVALATITTSFARNNEGGIKYPQSEEMVMEPETIPEPVSIESLERTILEDNKIIESDAIPAVEGSSLDRILYAIEQDHRITESPVDNTVYPLNFRKINKAAVILKVRNQKAHLVGSL